MCSRPARQTRRLRWSWWASGALLLPIIAIPVMAAAQGRQLQFVSHGHEKRFSVYEFDARRSDLVGWRADPIVAGQSTAVGLESEGDRAVVRDPRDRGASAVIE